MKETQSYHNTGGTLYNALRLILAVLIICFLMKEGKAQHNNELFIEGQLYLEQGAGVYVWGDVHIDGTAGALNNDGTLVVEGNFHKNNTANYFDSGLGQLVFSNTHVNTSEPQSIYGDFTGQNALSNLQINNQSPAPMLSLVSGNLEITNTLQLLNGALRTDAVSHAGDGALYSHEVYISNPSPNAIQVLGNPSSNYIEGKLRQEIMAGNNYTFPIGSVAEAEPFELNFRNAPTNFNILTYFKNLQSMPTNLTTVCNGLAHQATNITGRWMTEPSQATGYNYDVTLLPGSSIRAQHGNNDNLIAEGGTLAENCPEDTHFQADNLTSLSYFDIVAVSPNLAIELERIWAEKTDQAIIVHWTTASETNNMGFELERSTDASNFERIGWIAGQGNSSTATDYKYIDTNAKKNIVYYYRLKAIEIDGKYEYSPVVSASLEGGAIEAQVFPNPVHQNEKLSLIAISDGQLDIQIFDDYARQVFNQKTNTLKGEIINMHIPDLPGGVYLVTLTNGMYMQRTKLVVAQ